MKLLLFFFIVVASLLSNELKSDLTLQWLTEQPRSITKDFYIWRYLDQNITPEETIKVLGQAKRVNNRLLYKYAKKLQHKDTSKIVKCMNMKGKELVSQNPDCIEVGMSVYKATKLSTNDLDSVIRKIQKKYPNSAKKFSILNSNIPFTKLISSNSEVFFDIFNKCGTSYRRNFFNHNLPKLTIKRLQKNKKFSKTIKIIVISKDLSKMQKSLFDIEINSLEYQSIFYLAINAIRHHKKILALTLLEAGYENAYFRYEKDKVLFWQYKLTEDKKYLELLSKSWNNNIYSLLAHEYLNTQPTNILYNIETNQTFKSSFNYNDPFSWINILNDSKTLTKAKMGRYDDILNHKNSLGYLSFLKEKVFKYEKSYFITPYQDIINKYSIQRQALMYAIARQESRFVHTAISASYAMGAMQIMPFLSKAIAKEIKEPYDIYKQLDPKTNLKYSNHHLNFLESRLKHPLLIAYAYNGGIGLLKKVLQKGLFKKGKYEPFLSMELFPVDETREYGKKVLANYFIYKNYLDKKNKIKISSLFKDIKSPY
ncbi:Soluble lytic murein transglycosylase precursor [hydrothermal vent metagenome]|uniref:Soluble lytic murein transglycosylase n=1 Tax=hydrothermal vent metagenome TaxID=652676 RepID=A0A3B1E0X1_9ZZZZ